MHLHLIYTIKILRKHLVYTYAKIQSSKIISKALSALLMVKPLKRRLRVSQGNGELRSQKKSTTSPDAMELTVTPGPLQV